MSENNTAVMVDTVQPPMPEIIPDPVYLQDEEEDDLDMDFPLDEYDEDLDFQQDPHGPFSDEDDD